jgi:transposase
MNSLQHVIGVFGQILQGPLFPALREELGEMSEHHEQFVRALVLLQLDGFVTVRHGRGRPAHDRAHIARAFLAKAVFNIPHTRALLDRMAHDVVLRRLCGWEKAADIPDETVFSRAFAEFANNEFAQRVHAAVVQRTQSERLVGHILRDSTAIEVREKPEPKSKPEPTTPAVRRLHRKAGTAKSPEQMTRLERQSSTAMTVEEMLAELPRQCDYGCKLNTMGVRYRWPGYKLHLDVADGQIPISCVLTAASVNDTQVAIPLAMMSAQRVTNLYDLMDTGYDCTAIREHSRKLGHVPIIPFQKRGSQQRDLDPHEKVRMRERTAVERVYSRLKDEFGATSVRVRGWKKVMTHLMFGILALTADQILRWSNCTPLERHGATG